MGRPTTLAELEGIPEDIPYHFRNSRAYRQLVDIHPAHIIDFHLGLWIRARSEYYKRRSSGAQRLPINLEAGDINSLGTWSNSPQGHDFWSAMNHLVSSGNPLNQCKANVIRIFYNLELGVGSSRG